MNTRSIINNGYVRFNSIRKIHYSRTFYFCVYLFPFIFIVILIISYEFNVRNK